MMMTAPGSAGVPNPEDRIMKSKVTNIHTRECAMRRIGKGLPA